MHLISYFMLGFLAALGSAAPQNVKRQGCRITFFDDVDAKLPINYEPAGAWTHLRNQGSGVKMGTLSYTGTPNGYTSSLLPRIGGPDMSDSRVLLL